MTQPTSLQHGRYAIRYEVSRDPCGVLLLAVDNKMAGREVTIRQLADTLSPGQMQRIAQLNHATLPSVYDLFDEGGHRYLVTEHPVGQSLADIVLGPRLKEGTVIAWIRQVAQGLSYLHTQRPPLAHGDLRPDNIMLQDGRRIKIIGGTPAGCGAMPPSRYAAPEQISGGDPSPAADVYALGAILHHLLTNIDPNTQPLMAFAPPDVRRPDLSPATSAAIVRALSQQPAQRFPSVDAFVQALTAGGSDQSSGDIPVIGFTPSLPQGPVDGPTVRYNPSPSTPIPVPPSSGYHPEGPRPDPSYADPYQAGQTGYNQGYGPPPSRMPASPASSGGRTGMVILGVLLVLLLLGGGGWLAFSFLRNDDPNRPTAVAINSLPTTTRDEGRLLSAADQTATAQAGIVATTIPTLDFSQATAGALQTSTAATAAAVTSDLEVIYRRGVAYEDTGQYALAASDYDEVLRRDPTYEDAQERRDRVQIYLDATATAETQAAADAAATATAAAQPSLTPTPEPPTATPVGELLGDEFDAGELDPNRWSGTPNGGTIALAEGALQLAAPSSTCFPVVQALTSTLTFPAGNFDLSVVFRYSAVTPLGTGFMLSTDMPALCGTSDRAGAAWGGVWQDSQRGLIVDFHRAAAGDVPLKDIGYEYSPGTIDTNQHTFTIQRRGTTDTYIMDGATLFSETAGPAPRVLWFGNPGQSSEPAEWTALSILAVQLREQP